MYILFRLCTLIKQFQKLIIVKWFLISNFQNLETFWDALNPLLSLIEIECIVYIAIFFYPPKAVFRENNSSWNLSVWFFPPIFFFFFFKILLTWLKTRLVCIDLLNDDDNFCNNNRVIISWKWSQSFHWSIEIVNLIKNYF